MTTLLFHAIVGSEFKSRLRDLRRVRDAEGIIFLSARVRILAERYLSGRLDPH